MFQVILMLVSSYGAVYMGWRRSAELSVVAVSNVTVYCKSMNDGTARIPMLYFKQRIHSQLPYSLEIK